MIRSLRDERGKEKMNAGNSSHKRADLATTPRPFISSSSSPNPGPPAPSSTANNNKTNDDNTGLTAAQQHRDKLLTYQAQNARRTHIIDEAADFDTPAAGRNMWSTPVQRAMELKKQQKVLREQEWNVKPEWEKRKVVLSIDLKGGKAVRRMVGVERPREEEEVGDEEEEEVVKDEGRGGKGAFSRNPLLGGLIRPVWKGKGNGDGVRETRVRDKWRRVQDDNEDNEAWILDGGVYGGADVDGKQRRVGDEERAFG